MQATQKDILQLTQLVNSAYRGESSRRGWTTEADLFSGNRMSEPVLQKMMREPNAVVLKYEKNATIQGCVYLKKENDDVYLGMLTVSPELQANGIGKQLLFESEATAQKWKAKRIYMKVIDIRTKLIEWYLRHGYEDLKQQVPFNGDGSDIPNQPIFFTILQKLL